MSSVLLDMRKRRHKLLWGALPPPSHPQLLALPPPTWPSKHLAHLSTQSTSEQEGPGQTSPPGHGSASGSRIWPALARGQNREMFHRGGIYCLVLIKRLPVLLAVQDKEIKVQTRKVAHSRSHRESQVPAAVCPCWVVVTQDLQILNHGLCEGLCVTHPRASCPSFLGPWPQEPVMAGINFFLLSRSHLSLHSPCLLPSPIHSHPSPFPVLISEVCLGHNWCFCFAFQVHCWPITQPPTRTRPHGWMSRKVSVFSQACSCRRVLCTSPGLSVMGRLGWGTSNVGPKSLVHLAFLEP